MSIASSREGRLEGWACIEWVFTRWTQNVIGGRICRVGSEGSNWLRRVMVSSVSIPTSWRTLVIGDGCL